MILLDIQSKVLSFWFGEPSSSDYEVPKNFWFLSTPALDAQIRLEFEDIYKTALNGELDLLSETAEGVLALVLILDQFPRNMYRGAPHAFLSDPLALKIAKRALSKGLDKSLTPVQKMFFYLPFQHSECLDDQEISVELYKSIGDKVALDYALEHYEIIKSFGRFPHRNAILSRKNTPDEIAYLMDPHAKTFGQS